MQPPCAMTLYEIACNDGNPGNQYDACVLLYMICFKGKKGKK